MPASLFFAYQLELSAVLAEENLRWTDVIAVGNGMLKRHEATRVIGAWRKQAQIRQPGGAARFDVRRDGQKAGGFGIGVREVKKNADG